MRLSRRIRRSRQDSDSALDRLARLARQLLDQAERQGCQAMTMHTERGVHRITITKVSDSKPERPGNYQRPSLPRR